MLNRIAVAVMIAVAGLVGRSEGQFGLKMGMTKSEVVEVVGEIGDYYQDTWGYLVVSATEAINKRKDFVPIFVHIHPVDGLFMLSLGQYVETGTHGYEIRDKFDDTLRHLEKKYGEGVLVDYLRTGSIWKRPQDWMDALRHKDRFLNWASSDDRFPQVELLVKHQSNYKASLGLTYREPSVCRRIYEEKEREKGNNF